MIKFPDRRTVTEKILSLINPDYEMSDLDTAIVTWWQNIRETGGFGLTYIGTRAFEKAEIEFEEFDVEANSRMGNMSLAISLDKKMMAPYYFYRDQNRQRIKIYDSRVSLAITLYGTINLYLKSLDDK